MRLPTSPVVSPLTSGETPIIHAQVALPLTLTGGKASDDPEIQALHDELHDLNAKLRSHTVRCGKPCLSCPQNPHALTPVYGDSLRCPACLLAHCVVLVIPKCGDQKNDSLA